MFTIFHNSMEIFLFQPITNEEWYLDSPTTNSSRKHIFKKLQIFCKYFRISRKSGRNDSLVLLIQSQGMNVI